MPQIAQIAATYASQIFWLLIVFGLIYFGIGKSMLPKIEATVDARDRKIADDLVAAQSARAEADRTEEAYRSAMDAARAAALKSTQDAKAQAARDAEVRVKARDVELTAQYDAAEQRIAASRGQALASIEDVAAEAAQDIVARISGVTVDRSEAAGAVRAALAPVA
ncbi:ATPase [Sphingomonas solaris]|jgi:F-type H+-transporting ATPase subunit b|uniref:ATP synthase subunit b n=1 Tax=Alterirhizorhabdus solaris TaxID=2529389 RepID=A0A558R7X4_9SPHN|nr:ATPase [Sphingomonas solaris]TVV75484.1 ATPase [Sphingomonas solaris]